MLRKTINHLSLALITIVCCFAFGEAAFRLFDFDNQIEFEIDEELYWRFRPDQRGFVWMGNASFRSPEIRINNLGLRGPEVTPAANKKARILVLGDSYTFGSGVRDEETFCAVLGQALGEQVEVINAGVPGYGIFQMARSLRHLDSLLDPRIVVVAFPTGDIFRQPFNSIEEERAYLQTEEKRKRLRRFSQFAKFLYRKYYYIRARLKGETRGVPNEMPTNDNAGFADLWHRDQTRLEEVAEMCRQSQARFVIMPWPQHRNAEWDNLVIAGVRELGKRDDVVGLINLDQALSKYPADQLFIPGDGHPSATAHQAVGLYLAEAIERLVVEATRSNSKSEVD
jgi:hypothetical protein